ncbi:hypothetical protein [Halosquirtibacter xylanolyticus]
MNKLNIPITQDRFDEATKFCEDAFVDKVRVMLLTGYQWGWP